MSETIALYRPVGTSELALVKESGYVTKFAVRNVFLNNYEIKVVGVETFE